MQIKLVCLVMKMIQWVVNDERGIFIMHIRSRANYSEIPNSCPRKRILFEYFHGYE